MASSVSPAEPVALPAPSNQTSLERYLTEASNRRLMTQIRETVDRAHQRAVAGAYESLRRRLILAEADLPASPRTDANVRLANGLERDLARYFRAMGKVISEDALMALYLRYVEQE